MVISSFRKSIVSFAIFVTALSFYFVNLSHEVSFFRLISILGISMSALVMTVSLLMASKIIWNNQISYSHPIFREGLLGVLYATLLILSMWVSGSFNTTPVWMFILSITLYCVSSSMIWSPKSLKAAAILSVLFGLINLAFSLGNRGWDGSISGVFTNPNVMGAYFTFLLFFPLTAWINSEKITGKVIWSAPVMLFLYLVIESRSRSVLIALFAGLVTYLVFNSITKYKILNTLFFWGTSIIAILFIVVYPKLYRYEWFLSLNQTVYNLTGKEIYTGREVLWESYIDIVNKSPFIGHGATEYSVKYLNAAFSPHNYFIQIAMQSGWIGVTVIFLILYSVWSRFMTMPQNKNVRLAAGFLIATIIHESFEVSLTQNNFSIGILKWLILGIGTSFVVKELKNKRSTQQ